MYLKYLESNILIHLIIQIALNTHLFTQIDSIGV